MHFFIIKENPTIGRLKSVRWLNLITWCCLFIIMQLLIQCASIKTPTGGPKDETPPQIDSSKTFTPNLSVNFSEKEILLPFDEWVVLKDVAKNIVISPPLENTIDIKIKKKTVIVNLEEENLRPDATYTINFGDAIQDLTEGNAPPDFRFIFATGPYIDSLEVTGTVRDALTNELQEEVFVILYDILEDSVVQKERPYYFARTDKNGKFRIPNVKQDTFKIIALVDNNFNYLYDSEAEKIGFLDSNIITIDSVKSNFDLQIFQEEGEIRSMRPIVEHYGHIKLILNKPLTYNISVELENRPTTINEKILFEQDTIHYWYSNVNTPDSLNFYVQNTKGWRDTVTVQLKDQTSLDNANLQFQLAYNAPTFINQNPDREGVFEMNHPIEDVDTGKLIWFIDSIEANTILSFQIDTLNPKQLNFTPRWKEGQVYEVIILPDGLTDMFGLTNQDSIKLIYKVEERKKFGNVTATVENLDSSQHYVIQLLNKQDEVIDEFFAKNQTTATHKFISVKATDYKLRVIEDRNQNKRWDTGKYPNLQPEPIFLTPSVQNLRQNWELDIKLRITN